MSMERKDGGSPPRPGMASSLRCVALVGWVDHVGARSVLLPLFSVPPSTHKQTPTATPAKPRNSNAPRLLGVLGQVEQAVGVVLHDQQVVRLRHRVQLSNGWFGVVGFHVGLTASETAFADPHIHTRTTPSQHTTTDLALPRQGHARARGVLPVGRDVQEGRAPVGHTAVGGRQLYTSTPSTPIPNHHPPTHSPSALSASQAAATAPGKIPSASKSTPRTS